MPVGGLGVPLQGLSTHPPCDGEAEVELEVEVVVTGRSPPREEVVTLQAVLHRGGDGEEGDVVVGAQWRQSTNLTISRRERDPS